MARAKSGTAGRGGRGAAVVAVAAGLILVTLAAPRLIAGLVVAPHETLAATLATGEKVPLARIRRAIRAHELALSVYENPRDRGHLGQLCFAAANRVGVSTREGDRLLDCARDSHRRALSQSPALPYSWSQLAVTIYGRHGASPAFLDTFRQAIRSAPRTPRLVLAHARLGLRSWTALDDDLRAKVRDQLAWAVRGFPRRLTRRLSRRLDVRLGLRLLSDRPVLRCRLAAAWQRRGLEGCAALGG